MERQGKAGTNSVKMQRKQQKTSVSCDENSEKISRGDVQKKLASKIDKKALLFLKKVAKRNKKGDALSGRQFSQRSPQKVTDEILSDLVKCEVQEEVGNLEKNKEKISTESTLCAVSAELSASLVTRLTQCRIQEAAEKCEVKFEKVGEKFMISGSWDMINKVKEHLDEMKENVTDTNENISAEESENEMPTDEAMEELADDTETNKTAEMIFEMGDSSKVSADSSTDVLTSFDDIKDVTKLAIESISDISITPVDVAYYPFSDNIVPISHIDPKNTMITITPNRGQVHRIINKFPTLATEICEHCGYKSTKEGVTRHKQRRHPKVVYKCQVCDAAFGIRYDMRRHRMNHFDKFGKLTFKGKCLWNSLHPESDADLVNYRDFEENFNCVENEIKTESDSQGNQNSELVQQQRYSSVIASYPGDDDATSRAEKCRYPPKDTSTADCPVCKKTYPKKVLAVHMKIHREKELMPCEHCGMEFLERGKLNAHVKSKHHKGFICRICGIGLSSRGSLSNHLQGVHGDDIDCQICHKGFSTTVSLAKHIKREHNGEKNYHCDVCGKGFFEKRSMKNHKVTHFDDATKETLKPYSCSYCGKKFLQNHIRKMHENTHTGNKPYKCKQCTKAFPYLSMLHKHNKVHSDVRNFQCPFCPKAFKFRYKLRHHLILHTKERKNACSVCGKCFTTSTTLKLHSCTGYQLVMEKEGEIVEVDVKTKEGKKLLKQCNQLNATEENKTVYMCGFCEKAFDNITDINAHILIHQSEVTVVEQEYEEVSIKDDVSAHEHQILIDRESELVIAETNDNHRQGWTLENEETVILGGDLNVKEEEVLFDESQHSTFVKEGEHSVIVDQAQENFGQNMIVTNAPDGTEFVIHITGDLEIDTTLADEDSNGKTEKIIEARRVPPL